MIFVPRDSLHGYGFGFRVWGLGFGVLACTVGAHESIVPETPTSQMLGNVP